jgi:hypothetical protein
MIPTPPVLVHPSPDRSPYRSISDATKPIDKAAECYDGQRTETDSVSASDTESMPSLISYSSSDEIVPDSLVSSPTPFRRSVVPSPTHSMASDKTLTYDENSQEEWMRREATHMSPAPTDRKRKVCFYAFDYLLCSLT